jgi:arsenite/tail-anchored protein-transporting ATPase
MTRGLLFPGKGGVGKTTVAAATALRASSRGLRVLVTSTDPAHSLADVFDTPLGDRPTPLQGGLWAQQIDAQTRLERHWSAVRDYLVQLLAWGGLSDVQAEELTVFPGLDEILSLVDLRGHVGSGRYDLVVVDCAPTGETLRLLALPDALRWYVARVLSPSRSLARAVRPVASRVGGPPVPGDGVFGAVEQVHADLAEVHAMLQSSERSSVRLVLNPERLVVAEGLRTATSLSLFGYAVDAVVVNRLLPDDVTDPYLARWKHRHAVHLATVRESFAPTPVLTAPLLEDEPVGRGALLRLADDLYADEDETAVLISRKPVTVESDGSGYRLRVDLPFVSKDDLELHRRAGELHVKVGSTKRTIPLPAAVRRCEVAGARGSSPLRGRDGCRCGDRRGRAVVGAQMNLATPEWSFLPVDGHGADGDRFVWWYRCLGLPLRGEVTDGLVSARGSTPEVSAVGFVDALGRVRSWRLGERAVRTASSEQSTKNC